MRLKLVSVPIVALAAVLAVSAVSSVRPASAGQVWNVRVGDGGQGVAAATFLPGAITIHTGDTIHFVDPYAWDPHTVTSIPAGGTAPQTFVLSAPGAPPEVTINPLAFNPSNAVTGTQSYDPSKYYNSGFLFPGGLFNLKEAADLSFSSAGTYSFICLLHGNIDETTHKAVGMHVDVTVVSQGSPGPTSQADIDAAVNAQRSTLISAGVQAESAFKLTQATLSDGSTNWGVTAGGSGLASLDPDGVTDVPQFTPAGLSINTGDTVTWTNNTFTSHTVTFMSGGPDIPLLTPITASGGGPPSFEITSSVLLPAGGPTYDGTGYANSGFIDSSGGPFGSTFALKFTKPGTYQYICQLHDQIGMVGTINVSGVATAAAVPIVVPTPRSGIVAPNTGTGPAPPGSGGWLPAMLVLGILGATLALAGTRLWWRRAG